MDADRLNEAIVVSISGSPTPGVDQQRLHDRYGEHEGSILADTIIKLVEEAVAMPIDWGSITLVEGVNAIIERFSQRHPDLSNEALDEIARCVGWQLR